MEFREGAFDFQTSQQNPSTKWSPLQATLTKDLAKTFKVELPRVNFYEGLKNGNLASSIIHLTDN